MDKYIIQGPSRLQGAIQISGAKNAVLKLMAASLLVDGPTVIHNVPRIRDVAIMRSVLETLGMEVTYSADRSLTLNPPATLRYEAPYDLVSKMRASVSVLGPLLAKRGKARVAMPGGCNIGSRKPDLHLHGLEALGAELHTEAGFLEGKAKALKGAEIILDLPSVGATENILMASVLAAGRTVIENAAREPELVDLVHFLCRCGAHIEGAGSSRLEIEGVEQLRGVEHEVIADRIETGTFLIAAAITGGDITIENARSADLELPISKMRDIGATVEEIPGSLRVRCDGGLSAADVVTLPFPGFPTDLQAPIIALLSVADGTSIVTENVFESRFMAIDELNRMGTDIRTEGHHAVVCGVPRLSGVPVRAPDLRGGASLVLAGLAAEGKTEVFDIHHIDRGYEGLEVKLAQLGADIVRLPVEETLF